MKYIEEKLEELLKKCGCFDSAVVEAKIKKWPGKQARLNALFNIGLWSKCFTEDEISIIEASTIFDKYFGSHSEFEEFFVQLEPVDKEKFLELSHFYYCWCRDPDIYDVLDDSFKLIIMTSIIEALMSDQDFKEFNDWFYSECQEDIIIDAKEIDDLKGQIKFLWNEYKKVHGSTKKVKIFFDTYANEDDQNQLIRGFKPLDKRPVTFNHIVKFLYKMRSNFVHNADMVMLSDGRGSLGHVIDGRFLSIRMTIGGILEIFERGFIEYFKTRIK